MTSTTTLHEVEGTGIVIKESPNGNLFISDESRPGQQAKIEKADRLPLIATLLRIGRGRSPLPISSSMIDRGLLCHMNETRKIYGLPALESLDELEARDLGALSHERLKMRLAIEAALNGEGV